MRLTRNQITLDLAGQNGMPPVADGEQVARQFAAVLRLLAAEDRKLAEIVLIENRTLFEAARALRIAPATAGRRMQRVRNLLACPMRRAIAEHIQELADDVRSRAVEHFFLGYSVRLMAQHRHVARSVVQREIDYLIGWARGMHRSDRRGADPPGHEDDEERDE